MATTVESLIQFPNNGCRLRRRTASEITIAARLAVFPVLLLRMLPTTSASPTSWVTPESAGMFTHVMTLPQEEMPSARTSCPWDEAGLVAWSPPVGPTPDYTLPTDSRVLINGDAEVGRIVIPATSELIFADADIELKAKSLDIKGKLRIGSQSCRVRSKIVLTLTGNRPAASDPQSELHKGVVASGSGSVELFGALRTPTWTRLAKAAAAGESSVYLQECVEWQPGDEVLITTTHAENHRGFHQNEKATIASVECVSYSVDDEDRWFGKVTFSDGLDYGHYAKRHEYQAEVALLTRQVVVRGDDSSAPTDTPELLNEATCTSNTRTYIPCPNHYLTGYGGHLMIKDSGAAKISGVEFHRMGQTNEIGRYPVHLHMLGTHGQHSFVKDCSIHESYYRGIVVHSTSKTLVTRNVAYDVIGHCFYLESGDEEENEISFNLGVHVHPIGIAKNFEGQESDVKIKYDSNTQPALVPADSAASPFYFSNLHNNFTGNAATGSGWAGFSMVNFPKVINGLNTDVNYVPMNRLTMENGFYGNSCRSVGWFWSLASCLYVGGVLWEDSGDLIYVPGRTQTSSRLRDLKFDDGSDAYLVFVNTRVALAPVAAANWNVRSKWYNMDVVDIGERSMNAFGDVSFRNIYLKCRSDNADGKDTTSVKWQEKMWPEDQFRGFRSYDTGQRHHISDWLVDCGSESSPVMGEYKLRSAQIWSFPHGKNINQNQLMFRNITYVDEPDRKKFFSFDVEKTDYFSPFYMCFADADGSMSRRAAEKGQSCSPTIAGSAGMRRSVSSSSGNLELWSGTYLKNLPANMWFKLTGLDDGTNRGTTQTDDRCSLRSDAEYPFWVCDQRKIGLASFRPYPNYVDERSSSKEFGRLTHWGDSIEDGVPMSGQAQVVGPFEHSQRGGWFFGFYETGDDVDSWASPKNLLIDRVQMDAERVLVIAVQYPANTGFTIKRTFGYGSDDKVTYTEASSVEEVRRDASGSKYFFDDTYLYLRLIPTGDTEDYFTEADVSIPSRCPCGSSIRLVITATWDSGSGCGQSDVWCQPQTRAPPPVRDIGVVSDPDATPNAAECPAPSSFWPLRVTAPPLLGLPSGSSPSSSSPSSSSPSSSPPCDASALPANAVNLGDCTATLPTGSSCSPTCGDGYMLAAASECVAGMLMPATCEEMATPPPPPPAQPSLLFEDVESRAKRTGAQTATAFVCAMLAAILTA